MKLFIQHFETIASTQDLIKSRYQNISMLENSLHWVSCDFQSKGRGRMGREWKSEAGTNLLISVALKMKETLSQGSYSFFSFLALLSLCGALEELCGDDFFSRAFVKWPNDVMFLTENKELKKLSGVLVESKRSGLLVCGWGVNVRKNNFERSVSLEELYPKQSHSISALSLALRNHFKNNLNEFYKSPLSYQKEKLADLGSKWMKNFWGQKVLFEGKEFVAERLFEDGSLGIKDKNSGELLKVSSAEHFEMF